MKNKIIIPKKITFNSDLKTILDISQLKKIGAGHDGIIFLYNNQALKILKYNIELRKQNKLMTFEKILYFQNELDLKRIIKLSDILLDIEGVFSGYVMDYMENLASNDLKGTPKYKSPSDFLCEELIVASDELEEDFAKLTDKKVIAKDINRGSYIYTDNFMYLCDMDKYIYPCDSNLSISDTNQKMLNYAIAKFIYYEIVRNYNLDKSEIKQVSRWVKKSTNARNFIKDLREDISGCKDEPISEYVSSKVKRIVLK